MSPALRHECTRVPVTALASCGALLVAAEGPYLRFYHAKNSRYLRSECVFQAQAVHGISLFAVEHLQDDQILKLVIWGGRLARALKIIVTTDGHENISLDVQFSDVAKAPDWILDLAPRPSALNDKHVYDKGACVAVTAHNALLQLDIARATDTSGAPITLSFSELTASSRCILYSAHVFWESPQSILVAAGTAFGEIIYWSWHDGTENGPVSRTHRVFLGHEGSIFGVRISQELPSGCCQTLKRVIASCSDDRTIRIWDVSDIDTNNDIQILSELNKEIDRTRHTGFSNEAFDQTSNSSSNSLAIGWGHTSRVWNVHFLEFAPCDGAFSILSTGEDASLRTWKLVHNQEAGATLPYQLIEIDCAAYHSGKNIWSSTIHSPFEGLQQIICGGADSKITGHQIKALCRARENDAITSLPGYTVHDILSLSGPKMNAEDLGLSSGHKSSKKAEFFRSYCSIDQNKFLLTTNSGKVVIISLSNEPDATSHRNVSDVVVIDQLDDLAGYSVCTSVPDRGVAFIAGSRGIIHTYCKDIRKMQKLTTVDGKVGDMFSRRIIDASGETTTVLLTTLVGQKHAQLHFLRFQDDIQNIATCRVFLVPISEALTGSMCTSMEYLAASQGGFLFLGFRRGSIAMYSVSPGTSELGNYATLFRVIERVHGEETVTNLKWISGLTETGGQLLSVGRDGRLAVHEIDLLTNSVELAHHLTFPVGPNIEGFHIANGRFLVHGFSNKKWVLYDVDAEEEIMGVETGGAHRSWAFQPTTNGVGGTLVWTRASSMHIYRRLVPSHSIIRSGGHGREIKAISSSDNPSHRLIATGAEDTDIKLFKYADGKIICKKTLRKHTTGIQHLQWSKDGKYLFSSGGCEEFFVWRIRQLTGALKIGVVCEHIYTPESEHSDLRIMSFDILEADTGYVIAMVFSDSSLKVYRYNPTGAIKWQGLAKGLYFTSCLTQCTFVSDSGILTAGTDGHAAMWSLPNEAIRPANITIDSTVQLNWSHPVRIHQNSSKSMDTLRIDDGTVLIASGGDDGSLAFVRAWATPPQSEVQSTEPYATSPLVMVRSHASAVTACAMFKLGYRVLVVTSGNDQWVRLWELSVKDVKTITSSKREEDTPQQNQGPLAICRVGKAKTSVADVSSMALLSTSVNELHARVLVCGVGMEVMLIDLNNENK